MMNKRIGLLCGLLWTGLSMAAGLDTPSYTALQNRLQQEAKTSYVPTPANIWSSTCAGNSTFYCGTPQGWWTPGGSVGANALPVSPGHAKDEDKPTNTGGTFFNNMF